MCIHHSWASASRKLTPALAFRHQYFQSGNAPKKMPDCLGLVRYRTSPGIVSFFIPVPDWSDARQSCMPAFIHTNMNSHTHTHLWCAAWTWTGTWTFSMDIQHGHSAWTFSMDIQHRHSAWTFSKDMDMHYGHGHAQWTWTWTCTMDIEMDKHHGYQNVEMLIKV
jgi:hypothetical protein